MERFWNLLCSRWQLGAPLKPPVRVSGGYMHKMYRLDTQTRSFAIKLLNPEVMSRPEAMGNYRRAEALERVLEHSGLEIVPALSLNGQKMQCMEGQYYYVFPWVEHTALRWEEIETTHCALIGDLLAQMHSLPIPVEETISEPVQPENLAFNWAALARNAQNACPELAPVLLEHMPVLEAAQHAYNRAVNALPAMCCICNADMDCKNVLWQNGQPLVIDLECLELGNPVNDLIQLSLSWAGGTLCRIDTERLRTFLAAYGQRNPLPPMDWHSLAGLGYSWLDWLGYSLRRAFGETGADSSERRIGLTQALETMERISYYAAMQEEVTALFEAVLG